MESLTTLRELGNKVRQKRKADGLTQAEVAAFSGVGVRFVGELERGKPSVRMDSAIKVLQGLGLEMVIKARG